MSPERPTKKKKTDDDSKPNHLLSPEDKTTEPKKQIPSAKKPSPEKPSIEKLSKQSENENKPLNRLLKDKLRSNDSKKLELKSDPKNVIKQLFLVDLPDDFYSFWEMCKTLNTSDPSSKLFSFIDYHLHCYFISICVFLINNLS